MENITHEEFCAWVGGFVDACIAIMCSVAFTCYFFSESKTGRDFRYTVNEKVRESFVGHSWKAIKDKVCSRIEFEG
jgi:hypothetical protein